MVRDKSNMRRGLMVMLSIAATIYSSRMAGAEVIIDDFTQAVAVVEVSNGFEQHPAVTENVGDLGATRSMLFTASQTIPGVWSFDANITGASALTAELIGHTRTSTNSAVLTYPVRYEFSSADLTEGGINNAFLFDFRSHQGTEPPEFFRVVAISPSPSGMSQEMFVVFDFDFQLNDSAFTTIVPFSEFTTRGGATSAPDFSSLPITSLVIDFCFRNPREEIEWLVELDRIRIGRIAIPEPEAIWLAVGSVLSLVYMGSCRPRRNGGVRCEE
jgi:hypothetical protein